MPDFELASGPLAELDAELLVVTATRGAAPDAEDAPAVMGRGGDELAEALGFDLVEQLGALRFDGSVGTTARIPTRGAVTAGAVLVVGIGDGDDPDALRRAGAAVASATTRIARVGVALPAGAGDTDEGGVIQAFVEGVGLGAYRFERFKSKSDAHQLATVAVVAPADAATSRDAIRSGQVTASAAALVRDLVNLPPGDKRPPALAEHVRELLADSTVEVEILDTDALVDGGYGGLLGVGAGSTEGPRLVELRYEPADASHHVALVGKGITFDSGGLSLKPNDGMVTMKMDMAGAATVLGVVKAAADLELPVRVTGLMALAENMPSGTAIRPSDVLTIRGGTTVEVMNTDAEGRLVLADALVHASERSPDVIVDVATLTGAAVVSLGPKIGAVMATSDELADALLAASASAGEPFWRLPLATREYGEELKGDVADLKNAGWKGAGTIRAGLFLHEFVGEGIDWAHLDIAGVAWTDSADGYLSKGATGVPVRTLLSWLRGIAA